jgi:hypothetical protein
MARAFGLMHDVERSCKVDDLLGPAVLGVDDCIEHDGFSNEESWPSGSCLRAFFASDRRQKHQSDVCGPRRASSAVGVSQTFDANGTLIG